MTRPFPSSPPPMRRRMVGFNLIELMIVIAIVAILAAWALPDFRDAVQSHRVRARASDLQFAFEQARNIAIARGVPVTVSPTDTGYDNLEDEAAFHMDIVVFVDFDGDNVLDATDEVVQRTGMAEPGVYASAGKPAGLTFNALGEALTRGYPERSYQVCSRIGKAPEQRIVSVSVSGRVANTPSSRRPC